MLDNAMFKDVVSEKVTSATRREAVAHFQVAYDVIERRASVHRNPDRHADE